MTIRQFIISHKPEIDACIKSWLVDCAGLRENANIPAEQVISHISDRRTHGLIPEHNLKERIEWPTI